MPKDLNISLAYVPRFGYKKGVSLCQGKKQITVRVLWKSKIYFGKSKTCAHAGLSFHSKDAAEKT